MTEADWNIVVLSMLWNVALNILLNEKFLLRRAIAIGFLVMPFAILTGRALETLPK